MGVDLTDEQMAARLGEKPGPRVEMILLGRVLYHREAGGWTAYPDDD